MYFKNNKCVSKINLENHLKYIISLPKVDGSRVGSFRAN